MNVLITGGTGNRSCRLIPPLLQEGIQVRVLDVEPFDDLQFEDEDVELIVEDCARDDVLAEACRGIDTVVQLARAPWGADPAMIEHTDWYGRIRTLDAAREAGVEDVIFVTPATVYGHDSRDVRENDECIPVQPRGQTARKAEDYIRDNAGSVSVTILRSAPVVGTHCPGAFLRLFERIRTGKPVYCLGEGDNRLQLIDVDDWAGFLRTVIVQRPRAECFNLGANTPDPMSTTLAKLVELTDRRSSVRHLPEWLFDPLLSGLETWPGIRSPESTARLISRNCTMNTDRVRNQFDQSCHYTSHEALLRGLRWYLEDDGENAT